MEIGKKILIVDDDESTHKSLAMIFRMKGYVPIVAETGGEALLRSKSNRFDIAFLDISLPDMDGVSLLSPLRETNPDMAMIMVTGHVSSEGEKAALEKGADDYITKPLDMDQVLGRVEKYLQAAH